MARRRRMFRREDDAPTQLATGPGSVTGRQASGIILMSGIDDWVPPEMAARPPAAEPGVAAAPEDWLPPQMPERTSEPPTAERRRSTIIQTPPGIAAAAAATEPRDAAVRERELQKTLERVTHELDEALREMERLRGQIAAIQAAQAAPGKAPPEPPSPEQPAGTLNLNTASVDELVTLPGVGRRAAERLVEYREARGPLRSVGALLAVEGFNADRIARLRGRATV